MQDGLIDTLKLLNSELTPDEEGFKLFLDQILPLQGVHRSYANQPESTVLYQPSQRLVLICPLRGLHVLNVEC